MIEHFSAPRRSETLQHHCNKKTKKQKNKKTIKKHGGGFTHSGPYGIRQSARSFRAPSNPNKIPTNRPRRVNADVIDQRVSIQRREQRVAEPDVAAVPRAQSSNACNEIKLLWKLVNKVGRALKVKRVPDS
jgi:hypothetical protein